MKRKPNRTRKKKPSKAFQQDIDWAQRYGDIDAYKTLCARTHAATGGICCVCMKSPSVVVHHSRYLGDRDTPGINIFSCCIYCHKYVCHNRHNWVKSARNPLWGNHNTPGFEKRLQVSYKLLNQQQRNGKHQNTSQPEK